MKKTIGLTKVLTIALTIVMACSCTPLKNKLHVTKKWQPTLESIAKHQTPEWLKDAKLGILFVGPPKDFDDYQYWHWMKDVQMRRELGYKEPADEEFDDIKLYSTGQLITTYARKDKNDPDTVDYDALMRAYEKTGAKFFKSTLRGCYPGTEGLLMLDKEVIAARKYGFKIGIGYNLLGTGKIPAAGHPGFVDFAHKNIKNEVKRLDADYLFFDGATPPSSYLRTPELVAWFYNYADKKGKDVWVNDDLGGDCEEKWEFGDVLEMEGKIVDSVSPKTWVKWDMIRNQWNCWVNEFGIGMRTGSKWQWEYRTPEDMLHIFIDVVSKGGIWLVQMVNTKQAWENMWEIGDWLQVNGEAIYNTRPFFEPNPNCKRVPSGGQVPPEFKHMDYRYWWRHKQTVKAAASHGPLYHTAKKGVVYVIHWGWPGEKIVIPDIRAKESSSIRMLGVDKDLTWQQKGKDLVIKTPDEKPCKYAYSFKICLASD